MRDRDNRARISLKMLLQPRHRLRIQVVRRLIENQNIGLLKQQPAQRHPPFLPAREDAYLRVARRASQGIHRHFQLLIQIPRADVIELFLNFPLPLQQLGHFLVRHRPGEFFVDTFKFLQQIDRLLCALFHILADILALIELRLLLQIFQLLAG